MDNNISSIKTADETNNQDNNDDGQEKNQIKYLQNPHLSNLKYIERNVSLYSNLYKIIITENKDLYEYALDFKINDGSEHLVSTKMKRKIMNKNHEEITKEYGIYILAGDAFYSMKKVDEIKEKIIQVNNVNYSVMIKPTKEIISLKTDMNYMMDKYKNGGEKEIKTIFEIMIKEILRHNPSLKYVMKLFGNKDKEKTLKGKEDYNSIKIMPGFITRVMVLENGFYLNVDIKSKIISEFNCLQLIDSFVSDKKKIKREEKNEINDWFYDKIIETSHTNQRFKIEKVDFDKKANNTDIKIGEQTKKFYQYYKDCFNIDIDKSSPLLVIKQKGKKEFNNQLLYPPEVCHIVGLNDDMVKDQVLLKKVYEKTKLTPNNKIENINDILSILNEKKPIVKVKNVNDENITKTLKSSYEKKIEFGIDIIDAKKENFEGLIMESPYLLGKNNNKIKNPFQPFKVIYPKEINFILFYHKYHEQEKKKFFELVKQASKGYGLIIGKMDYRYLNNEDPEVWKKEIKQYAYNSKYNIVLILLDDYLNKIGLYDELKYFSQENEGIISQFILTNSFTRKNGMSVVSNILIQINTKIGGISYVIDFDKNIKDKHLMIIGINSSKLIIDKVPYLSISYCASLNDDFTEYTNKKEILNEEENRNNSLSIGVFLYEALIEYFKKNKKFPGGVIIYRQGISEGKESVIMGEIEQINDILTGNSPYETIKGLIIPYYYILVNKRSTIKFFESSPDSDENDYYENPENGLLVIRKAVRDEIFEFYIQPQKVNSGTATPTNYRVMYGTMNNHDILPKLSFDLCYLYSNWRGPVRIPAPLKYAEKLAKLKYGINDNVKNSLCFI